MLHADDEAFLRGRGVRDGRVYGGRPFRLDEHLDRLAPLREARVGLPSRDVEELAGAALAAAGEPTPCSALYWTPGARAGRARPRSPLVAELPPDLEERRARGHPPDLAARARAEAPWLLGGVKSTSYAREHGGRGARRARRGADDAVFLAGDGTVLEAPTSNVWWRRGRTLFTPALELGILAGVTRALLLESRPRLGYEVVEGAFPLDDLAAAEEAFTSSSVREVMPVVELDGRPSARPPGEAAARSRRRSGSSHVAERARTEPSTGQDGGGT